MIHDLSAASTSKETPSTLATSWTEEVASASEVDMKTPRPSGESSQLAEIDQLLTGTQLDLATGGAATILPWVDRRSGWPVEGLGHHPAAASRRTSLPLASEQASTRPKARETLNLCRQRFLENEIRTVTIHNLCTKPWPWNITEENKDSLSVTGLIMLQNRHRCYENKLQHRWYTIITRESYLNWKLNSKMTRALFVSIYSMRKNDMINHLQYIIFLGSWEISCENSRVSSLM